MDDQVFDRIQPEFEKAVEFWSLVYAYPNDIINESLTTKDDSVFAPTDDSDFGYTSNAEQFIERAERRQEAYETARSTLNEFFEMLRDLNRYLQASTTDEQETINDESEWALSEHKEVMDSLLERDIELVFSSEQMFMTDMLQIKNTRSNPSALFTAAMNTIEDEVFDGDNAGRMNYAQPNTKTGFVPDNHGQYRAVMEPVDDMTSQPIARDADEANNHSLRHKEIVGNEPLPLDEFREQLEQRTRTVANSVKQNTERFDTVSS